MARKKKAPWVPTKGDKVTIRRGRKGAGHLSRPLEDAPSGFVYVRMDYSGNEHLFEVSRLKHLK